MRGYKNFYLEQESETELPLYLELHIFDGVYVFEYNAKSKKTTQI